MSDQPREPDHWTLDKRIPIALLVGIVLSTLGVGSTAVVAHHRLASVERHLDRIEVRNERDGEARRALEREMSGRDRQVSEALADLRATTAALRDAVTELRATFRGSSSDARRQ